MVIYRFLRDQFPGVVQHCFIALATENDHMTQRGKIPHPRPPPRWRRLRHTQLFQKPTTPYPSQFAVLVYAAAPPAEENHCLQLWIECGGTAVHPFGLN